MMEQITEPRLTDRQKEVLELVISGKPTKIIAFRLGVAESTVKNHLYWLYKAYDVRSRYELMALVYESKIHTLV